MVLSGSIRQIDRYTVDFGLSLEGESVGSFRVSSNVPLRANPTALIAAFLPIAAKMGYDLSVEGAVDGRAVANSVSAIGTMAGWWPEDMTDVRLLKPTISAGYSLETRGGVACLASLGLDSFYSMNMRREEITHLVILRGFDIRLDNDTLWEKIVTACRVVAAAEGKQLIEVTTSIRDLSDGYVDWGRFHGAAIANVAHLLDGHFSHLIIPSSFSPDDLMPWGSHPDLDHLWSSASLTFEHTLDVDRVQKMRAVADDPNAMRYLHVCTKNLDSYNCGQCEKCIRTMCNAIAAGAGGRIQSLPAAVTPDDIMRVRVKPPSVSFLIENLKHLRLLPDGQRRRDLEVALEVRIEELTRQ